MTYQKPQVEVFAFENDNSFMMASGNTPTTFTSPEQALQANCGGYNGEKINNFSCTDFGGYNASNPPKQNEQVTIAGTTYVFDYKGNHWKLHK